MISKRIQYGGLQGGPSLYYGKYASFAFHACCIDSSVFTTHFSSSSSSNCSSKPEFGKTVYQVQNTISSSSIPFIRTRVTCVRPSRMARQRNWRSNPRTRFGRVAGNPRNDREFVFGE